MSQVTTSREEFSRLLGVWERGLGTGTCPVGTLEKMAEIVEYETENFLKKDPDPFDDRHPIRADPDCELGHVLKALFKHEIFMDRLVHTYVMTSREFKLNMVACRLLLDILPGLEASIIFQETEGLVTQLTEWAKTAEEPLGSYATGLLASAMDLQEIASISREENSIMVPIMLKRLEELKRQAEQERSQSPLKLPARPFGCFGKGTPERGDSRDQAQAQVAGTPSEEEAGSTPDTSRSKRRKLATVFGSPPLEAPDLLSECSNSSWAEISPYVIGYHRLYPLSPVMKQRLILQYLTPLGEYQELLGIVFEHGAMDLVMHYIDLKKTHDVRLTFEGLKYLAALLCHKKFASEFVAVGGLQRLLAVHRPSMAATGVSVCLYYLTYNEIVMESICLLPPPVLPDLINYALWLLECSHESGRCHATMFFTLSFHFRSALELFDQRDGLRKLFNLMSTLELLNVEDQNQLWNEDQIFASRQTVKHCCNALRRYFECHLALKVDSIKRSFVHNQGLPSPDPIHPSKGFPVTVESVHENMETILDQSPARIQWEPVNLFLKLQGVDLLFKIISFADDWRNYGGRSEVIKAALDILALLAVTPKVQIHLCEHTEAFSIILGMAEGATINDPEVQKSALQIITNCVCGPSTRLSSSMGGKFAAGNRRHRVRSGEETIGKIWGCVKANNGIRVLLSLLLVKSPITEADEIRWMACKALCGLVRSDVVKQIVSKLPLFNNGQLQILMREPVLQDKRSHHLTFCKYASDLTERVTGKPMSIGCDTSLDQINKMSIVAQTKITYNPKELLQLIYNHLLSQGLDETALALLKEADLPKSTTSPALGGTSALSTPPSVSKTKMYGDPKSLAPQNFAQSYPTLGHGGTASGASVGASNEGAVANSGGSTAAAAATATGQAPLSRHLSFNSDARPSSLSSATSTTESPSNGQKIHASLKKKTPAAAAGAMSRPAQQSYGGQQSLAALKRQMSTSAATASTQPAQPTLDDIIQHHLTEIHSRCKHPVATCPPFSLLEYHQCPEPKYRRQAPDNVSSRILKKQIFPAYGGFAGKRSDRQYLYSRFRPVQTYRDDDCSFTTCMFSKDPADMYLCLGTISGDVKIFNMYTSNEEAHYTCHGSGIESLELSNDGKLMLTSCSFHRPLSALWSLDEVFERKLTFEEDHYMEFGKLSSDRIVGTHEDEARIYDTATGQTILTLVDPELSNHYNSNKATFDPNDDLVLSDGVLWDVRSLKAVHKFDKFNINISGVFHPSGLEVVINTEVWDVRTFHLLHTVPGLHHCEAKFNTAGDVLFGVYKGDETLDTEDENNHIFSSSFKTFDATDYRPIATMDVKKDIYGLACDPNDMYLAVIENSSSSTEVSLSIDSTCRVYEVGRMRKVEGEEDEEDEQDDAREDDDDDEEGSDGIFDITEDEVEGDNEDGENDEDEDDEEEDNEEANDDENAENSGESESSDDDGVIELDDDDIVIFDSDMEFLEGESADDDSDDEDEIFMLAQSP